MKLWMKLFLVLLLVSILPTWLLSRYARSYFHVFTRRVQEEQMAQTGRWMGTLHREVTSAAEREALMRAHAADSGRRLRFFDAAGNLQFDSGERDPLFFDDNAEVKKAAATGKYAARWWLMPDRSRLYYFAAVPAFDGEGQLIGVAQVIEHTGRITTALMRLHRYQQSGLLAILGGSVLCAVIFSWLLTRRLRRLQQAARQFAAGGRVDGFRMRGRDEVAELAGGFQEMAVQLKARQAYNRDFVQTTLHELRTPLTAMHGAADILRTREGLTAAERQRFSTNIQVQSDRLLQLVQALQSLTSLDAVLPEEKTGRYAAGPLVAEILERIRPAFRHAVALEGAEIKKSIDVSPERVEQVLINLLENADRYHQGEAPLRVQVREEQGRIRLQVEDAGPGIREADPLRIFDRYFTTVPRDANREYGRGLGLAIVKRIMEHYHGGVFAENRPEGGARVGVLFS